MNWFTEHPRSVGETYWQHLKRAMKLACDLVVAGLACCIHAIFPWLFKTTASNTIFGYYYQFAKYSYRKECHHEKEL